MVSVYYLIFKQVVSWFPLRHYHNVGKFRLHIVTHLITPTCTVFCDTSDADSFSVLIIFLNHILFIRFITNGSVMLCKDML